MMMELDPRVQHELERLNEASNVINQLENKLSETRTEYRTALSESTHMLNLLAKKLGDCVAKARPFYDAKQVAREAQTETQHAAVRFERAVSMHAAAREMVAVAEQGMEKGNNTKDTAWQEMLNHATLKVNDAEAERLASGDEHQQKMEIFKKAESNMNTLQRKLKFNIIKSRKYFELKEQTNHRLMSLVNAVNGAEKKLQTAKTDYSQALRSLENISDSIHAKRKSLGVREEGVGAETAPEMTETKPLDETQPEKKETSETVGVSPSSDLRTESFKSVRSYKSDTASEHQKSDTASGGSHDQPAEEQPSNLAAMKNSEILLSVADLSRVKLS